MPIELTERERQVLLELLKNSKISDKELAKKLSTSQPTITRIRNKLYESGHILNYTVTPEMSKVGIKILAFTFISRVDPNVLKKLYSWIAASPKIIYSSEGAGLREARLVIISAHSDLENFNTFLNTLRNDFGNGIVGMGSFLVPGGTNIKEFNLHGPIENQFRAIQKSEKGPARYGVQIPQMPSMPQVKIPRFGRKKAK